MTLNTRQTKIDYTLMHEYVKYVGFCKPYHSIYLVEPAGPTTFVIRLKFSRIIDTYPIYVTNNQWKVFLKYKEQLEN